MRDFHVTGVQTCALPIYPVQPRGQPPGHMRGDSGDAEPRPVAPVDTRHCPADLDERAPHAESETLALGRQLDASGVPQEERRPRSEERRVGKEGDAWATT